MISIIICDVRYQRNRLYIVYKINQYEYDKLQKITNILVNFSIRVYDKELEDSAVIDNKDVFFTKFVLVLRVPLKEIHRFQDTSIHLDSIGFKYGAQKRMYMPIRKLVKLSHIHINNRVDIDKNLDNQENFEKKVYPLLTKIIGSKFQYIPLSHECFGQIKKKAIPAELFKELEEAIEDYADTEVDILENDIDKLLFDCYLSCLSNLPRPFGYEGQELGKALMETLKDYFEEGIA